MRKKQTSGTYIVYFSAYNLSLVRALCISKSYGSDSYIQVRPGVSKCTFYFEYSLYKRKSKLKMAFV